MAQKVIHYHDEPSDSGLGFLVGVVLLIAFLAAFMYWGLPMLRNMNTPSNGGSQINVPGKIDVNVNQPTP